MICGRSWPGSQPGHRRPVSERRGDPPPRPSGAGVRSDLQGPQVGVGPLRRQRRSPGAGGDHRGVRDGVAGHAGMARARGDGRAPRERRPAAIWPTWPCGTPRRPQEAGRHPHRPGRRDGRCRVPASHLPGRGPAVALARAGPEPGARRRRALVGVRAPRPVPDGHRQPVRCSRPVLRHELTETPRGWSGGRAGMSRRWPGCPRRCVTAFSKRSAEIETWLADSRPTPTTPRHARKRCWPPAAGKGEVEGERFDLAWKLEGTRLGFGPDQVEALIAGLDADRDITGTGLWRLPEVSRRRRRHPLPLRAGRPRRRVDRRTCSPGIPDPRTPPSPEPTSTRRSPAASGRRHHRHHRPHRRPRLRLPAGAPRR